MAVTEYHCLNSGDDAQLGDGASTTGTTILISDNRITETNSTARVDLDTSGISDTITAATLYWYNDGDSDKSPKAATYDHEIYFYNGGTKGAQIYDSTVQELDGLNSHALTAGELSSINTSGDTSFLFEVPAPGASETRSWTIRAWDFVPNGDFSVYLEVTTEDAAGNARTIIVSI